MIQLQVHPPLIQWYHSYFLQTEYRYLNLMTYSTSSFSNSGTTWDCVSSPLLFTLYAKDCKINVPNAFIWMFSDDVDCTVVLVRH